MNTFVKISFELDQTSYNCRPGKVALDLIAHIPREEIVYFRPYGKLLAMEGISTQLPNLKGLHFKRMPLLTALPRANFDEGGERFPCLQYIYLDRVVVSAVDTWGPLTTFLLWHTNLGRRLRSLAIVGSYRAPPSFTQAMVQEFRLIPAV